MLKGTTVKDGRTYFLDKSSFYDLPDLIKVQRESYKWFLEKWIKEVFDEMNPITDFGGTKMEFRFISYELSPPRYDFITSKEKKLSYESSLTVRVQLLNKETGEIKEQDIYLGGIPLMTPKATFIINGIERVVVNQIIRSEGVFIGHSADLPGKYNAKVIPNRGAWLEIETGKDDVLYMKINRKRKFPVTSFIKCFGFDSDTQILEAFEDVEKDKEVNYILNTLRKDSSESVDEALIEVYGKIRPGDMATPENAKSLIDGMFINYRRYDMGSVGRYKINSRFGLKKESLAENRVFQIDEFILMLKDIINLNNEQGEPDDIDSLENRRIRAVGEQILTKFRAGLLRTERIIKDRMTIMDLDQVTPQSLINSHPVSSAIKEFFMSSPLSHFMDQANPLAELEHKRRITAMGPGGLSRDRASFDVRDIHPTYYGRICPIQTPEGPNIGLVNSLATYSQTNEHGFLLTPYRKVRKYIENEKDLLIGRKLLADVINPKTEKVVAQRKDKEGNYIIVDEKIAEKISKLPLEKIKVRPYVSDQIDYFDALQEKEFAVAAAGEKVDPQTGEFEEDHISARKSFEPITIHIKDLTHVDVVPQQIMSVSSSLIPFIEHDESARALTGSNQQRQAVPLIRPQAPLVGTGMEKSAAIYSGDVVVADSDSEVVSVDGSKIEVITKSGEKKKYNLQYFTRSNQETLICQKPAVSKGQKIKKGDVIVEGPAMEDGELALGQNLLAAYMPWRGYNYEDSIIVSDRVYRDGLFDSVHIYDFIVDVRDTQLGKEVVTRDIPNIGQEKLKNLDEDGIIRIGAKVREGDILIGKITPKWETELTPEERLLRSIFGDKVHEVKDTSLRLDVGQYGKVINVQEFSRSKGNDLPTGVLKQYCVSVAKTIKLFVGDKMAGRHGNKGIVSAIEPLENMPFLEDGTAVDIVLTPMGVITRMNVWQLLECHVGWAAKKLGIKIASPVLNGLTKDNIKYLMSEAKLPLAGKVPLRDGLTGDEFDSKVTVGFVYMVKLNHLVDSKMHARSVGPYSLITQQPLGGKANKGGQRFGEMEVWALEAYGAVNTLQEMLTIKSDDVVGRNKCYEAILKWEDIKKIEMPASFDVLVKELEGCGLTVKLGD